MMDSEGGFVSFLILEVCKKIAVPHKCKKHGDCEYEIALNKAQNHGLIPIGKNNAIFYFYDGHVKIMADLISKDISLYDPDPITKAADIITVLLTYKQEDEWDKIRNQKPMCYKNASYDELLKDVMFQSVKSQVDDLCSLSSKK